MLYSREQIEEVSHKAMVNGEIRSGRSASYIKLDDDWGFKWYVNEYTFKTTLARHKRAEALGFGPKIGEQFELQVGLSKAWGYIIEHVRVADEIALKEIGVKKYDDLSYEQERKFNEIERKSEELKDGLAKLKEKMQPHNFRWMDSHSGNWGWTKQGVPVRIDFDDGV